MSAENKAEASLYRYARQPLKRSLAESLFQDQGGYCPLCREKKMLEIDHMDGNPLNWGYNNLRLLCHECNIAERNRHQRSMQLEREKNEERTNVSTNPTELIHNLVDYQGGSPEMQTNDIGIPKLTDWWCQRLQESNRLSRFEAINKGAANCGLTYQPVWRAYNKVVYQPLKEDKPDPFAPFIEEKDERTAKRFVRLRLSFKIEKIGKYLKPVPDTEIGLSTKA